MNKKSAFFEMQLNSISSSDNPTKKEVEFIIHDFSLSKNNTIIAKETALKALDTLEDTPIVAKYHENSGEGSDDDALGSHEAVLGTTRDGKDYYVELQTTPIGVFTEPAYVKTIEDVNGEEKEVVAGKGVLWASRFPNVIGLLQEWIDRGITISSSMEILYDEYTVKDGVEEILNFVYDGHAVLNSETRGDHEKVEPAYDVSKLNKLVAQAMIEEKESDTMPEKFKKVFELSHSDIRTYLYRVLDEQLEENQYSWIREVYDDKFVTDIDTVTDDSYDSKTYQYDYTKNDDDSVTINFDSKVEVMKKTEWVQLDEVKELQSQLNEKDETIQSLSAEKEDLDAKFNDASEKLISLNSKVDELSEYKEKYDQEQFDKKLSEKKEFYSAKFEAVNAKDKFESEEVQELVTQSVSDESAITQLNSILVDLVVNKQTESKENEGVKQLSQKRGKLVETETLDFESRYK